MKENLYKLIPIKEIYSDIFSPAAKKIGIILEDLINLAFYPIDAFEKIPKLFYNNFLDYIKKFEDVSSDSIIKPANEIAVPILSRFKYIESDELKELFANLLFNASIKDKVNKAHPAFINVIDNLAVDEARILKYMYKTNRKYLIFISWNNKKIATNGILYKNGRATICAEINIELHFTNMIDFYLDNLIQLGLLHSSTLISQTTHDLPYYENDMKRLYEKQKAKDVKHDGLPDLIEGGFGRTEFCELFMNTCIDND